MRAEAFTLFSHFTKICKSTKPCIRPGPSAALITTHHTESWSQNLNMRATGSQRPESTPGLKLSLNLRLPWGDDWNKRRLLIAGGGIRRADNQQIHVIIGSTRRKGGQVRAQEKRKREREREEQEERGTTRRYGSRSLFWWGWHDMRPRYVKKF